MHAGSQYGQIDLDVAGPFRYFLLCGDLPGHIEEIEMIVYMHKEQLKCNP